MLDLLCVQPSYDTGDKAPAPMPQTPTMSSLFDSVAALWQVPTPRYEGQVSSSSPGSPGLLCWLVGSPTPAYQAASASGPSQSPSQSRRLTGR